MNPASAAIPIFRTAPTVPAPSERYAARPSVTLSELDLKPGWYILEVETSGGAAVVSALAQFRDGRASNLRIRLEDAGPAHFIKILKTAEPLASLRVSMQGARDTRISDVTISPLKPFEIARFLLGKGVRYALARRRLRDWRNSLRYLRATLFSPGSFAFRARYRLPDDNYAYPRWRAIHEHPETLRGAAQALRKCLGTRVLRIAVIAAGTRQFDEALATTRQSLSGGNIELTALRGPEDRWDFVLPVDHAGAFSAGAIEHMALALIDNPAFAAVFADSDEITSTGLRQAPRLKPGWDPELLWCTDYIRSPLMVRWRPDLRAALSLQGADRKPGYALAVHLVATCEPERLHHIPEILFHENAGQSQDNLEADRDILQAHLRAAGKGHAILRGDGILRVDWPLPEPLPVVSIIIPSRDNADLLRRCINSIRAGSKMLPQIIVADNDSRKPDMLALLKGLKTSGDVQVMGCPGAFNFSRINNDARGLATGDVLVFLNDDTRILSENWLTELVSLAVRPEIGAVGPMLLYPNGEVQHAGVLLGVGGIADHAFRYAPGDSGGYLNLLRCRREVTAVTGACLAIRAETFDAVGGFDEALPVTLNDVDLCLRVRASGKRNVWTPWAVVEHVEAVSRGIDVTAGALARQAAETRLFSERWSDLLDCDPTYHPGLCTLTPDYRLSI